jgi:pSer/pThr/pTyr-binding forkhead associated (FHA) protein
MKARLFCTTGPYSGANFEFSREATIGKSRRNNIVLTPAIISNRHARIYWNEAAQCYVLEDLGSRNGTQVDGVRVNKNEKLGALNIITFAQKFDFIFQAVDNYEQAPRAKAGIQRTTTAPVAPKSKAGKMATTSIHPKEETAEVAPRNGHAHEKLKSKTMVENRPQSVRVVPVEKTAPNRNGKTLIEAISAGKRMAASQPAFFLEINGRNAKTFRLKNGENLLGRSPECEIAIDDPSISRRHAVLIVNAGKVFLKDLGSKNHTFVGRQTVINETEIRLDTALRFGKVEAQLIRRTANERYKASRIGQLV